MSEEIEAPSGLSRKEKKAKRDAERAGKFKEQGGKKSKANRVENANPRALKDEVAPSDETAAVEKAALTDAPKAKKRKSQHDTPVEQEEVSAEPIARHPAIKKRKTESVSRPDADGKKSRFIVFIGNLPYSTTDASLDKHFEKLKPYTVRHRTDPKTKKSKGFAFLEFDNYDRMKTCLKVYHHSTFDPDNPGLVDPEQDPLNDTSRRQQKKGQARKINVELTAGGGGSKEVRKEKIKVKNTRLEEQRMRRLEAERKEKIRKQRKAAAAENEGSGETPAVESSGGGIHPSRLARMAGGT